MTNGKPDPASLVRRLLAIGRLAGERPWWVDDLFHAALFLTRLPVPLPVRTERPLMHAGWAFPVIGLLVGGSGGAVLVLAGSAGVPWLASALLALAATALLTGALHEDGLADMADGFGGGSDRARKIDIMRDSRTGSYGVLALILATGLKAAALAHILAAAGPVFAATAFTAAQILCRTAMPPLAFFLPPASPSGSGNGAGRPKAVTTGLCLALGLLAAFVLLPLPGFILAIVAAGAGALAVALLARWQIGGYTGDVLGGGGQIVESLVLLSLSLPLAGRALSIPLAGRAGLFS